MKAKEDFTEVEKSAEYPINLLNELGKGEWPHPLPSDYRESVEYALATLTVKEWRVIHKRYSHGMTLAEIGKSENLTKERIRQIKNKAIRKLMNPSLQEYFIHGVKAIKDKAVYDALKAKAVIAGKAADRIMETPENEEYDISEISKIPWLEVSVKDLDLSVRSLNCLRRSGVNTFGDIVKMTQGELMTVRNLGRKSYVEITELVHKLGYVLADEKISDTVQLIRTLETELADLEETEGSE